MAASPAPGRSRLRRTALLAVCLLGGPALLAATAPPDSLPTSVPAQALVPDAGTAVADVEEPGPGVTVAGNRLLRDGDPWLPRGFNMVGLLTPAWCNRAVGIAARGHFGAEELAAARDWGADVLRFQVSQRGLADETLPEADRAAYRDTVLAGVAQARDAGFAVIVSMQDQFYGCGEVHPLPSAQTVAAWESLAPALVDDPSVLLELFNEPQNEADAAGWAQWRDGGPSPDPNLGDVAVGHQELVDTVRELGSTHVLIADTARLGERSTGLPLLTDPLQRTAYGIHPYYYERGERWWDDHYGDLAAVAPVLATEWNYLPDECGTWAQRMAPDLLDYLRRHGIGVFGHAFDIPRTTIADWSWTPTKCGTAVGGSGALLREYFLSLPATDTVPPAVPTGLRATSSDADEVSLAWDADPDATGYVLLRDGERIATPSGPEAHDAGLRASTTYTYTVRAVDAAGNVSGNAVPLQVTTPGPPPDTAAPVGPASLDARVPAPGSVRLAWPAATDDVGVTGYRVIRDGTALATVTGRSWTDGSAPAGARRYEVVALDAAGNVSTGSSAEAIVPASAPAGLTGTYFDTASFGTQRLVRVDRRVDFSWGTGRPAAGVGAETFSVRWTGRVLVPADGAWTFSVVSDEGVRVWVGGTLVVDDWTAHRSREARCVLGLTDDRAHDVRIEYYDRTGTATVRLLWSGPGTAEQVVPSTALLSR